MNSEEKILISEAQIQKRIAELAAQVHTDYKDQELVIIGVLTGAYLLTADLTRALWKDGYRQFLIDFIGVASYGNNTTSSKNPTFTKEVSITLLGKHVLIVEDIIETGLSLAALRGSLLSKNPASIKTLVLLSKEGKLETDVVADYTGFSVGADQWVEGYGLDTSQYGRGRPEVIERIKR